MRRGNEDLVEDFKDWIKKERIDEESKYRFYKYLREIFPYGSISTKSDQGKVVAIILEKVEIRFERGN